MGVLIIFSITSFICITYLILEPTERLKQQLYFFGKFPKGTKVKHSPTKDSIIITFPSDLYGTEIWEFDRISKNAKMQIIKDEVLLEQNLELNVALDKFISDRRLSSLFFKLIKTAFLYLWYLVSVVIILASVIHLLLIFINGNNQIIPQLPSYLVGIILISVSVIIAWLDIRLYLLSKNKNKIRIKFA